MHQLVNFIHPFPVSNKQYFHVKNFIFLNLDDKDLLCCSRDEMERSWIA